MVQKITVPQLSEEENNLVNALLEQIGKKSIRNKLRTAYYDGKRVIKHVGGVIPEQYRNLGMVLGWASKGVDGLARRTGINGFVWPDGTLNDIGWMELEENNFLLAELSQARTDSLIHGVSYLTTTRGVGDEPRSLVHAVDALNATGFLNPRTRRLDSFLSVHEWDTESRTPSAFELFVPGVIVTAIKSGQRWSVDRKFHSWGVPVETLVYRPRVSRRRGRSRISRPVMSHQDAAVRSLIRMEAHMDIYAIPKLLFLGADEGIFKNADGSLKDNMQIMMGRIMGIPDDQDLENPRVDVQSITAESPAPHLSQLNALAKLMARDTDLPDSDFALTDLANPTSEGAYYAGRENLIAEAEGAQEDWNVPVKRTIARALAIQDGLDSVPDSYRTIVPDWRPPVYLSRSQQADAGLKILSAAPELQGTEVGYELLGLTRSQIDRVRTDRARESGRDLIRMIADGDSS